LLIMPVRRTGRKDRAIAVFRSPLRCHSITFSSTGCAITGGWDWTEILSFTKL